MIFKSLGRALLRACARLLALAALAVVTGCSRDDPISVLEVTTTVIPTLASIARDTGGVLIVVQVRNTLDRKVRVVIRPGRGLRGGRLSYMGNDSKSSYGLGASVVVEALDSLSITHVSMSSVGLPEGIRTTFEAGGTVTDSFRLGFLPKQPGQQPDLSAGQFLIRGGWNTVEGPGVRLVVLP